MVRPVGALTLRGGAHAAARVGPGNSGTASRPEPAAGASVGTERARRRTDCAGDPRPHLDPDDGSAQLTAADLLRLDPILLALAESERHFRTLVEQAADGILMVDGTGRITLANSRACEMTGYAQDEILRLTLLDTYLPEEREIGRERIQRMPAGATLRFQRDLLRKDGARMPIAIIGAAVRLPGGVNSLDDLWALLRDHRDAGLIPPMAAWRPFSVRRHCCMSHALRYSIIPLRRSCLRSRRRRFR